MSDLAHSFDSRVFVQFGDGTECFFLGDCAVVPTLGNPATDRSPVFSSIGAREFSQIGFEPGAPGATTLAITTFVPAAANYLEQIKESGCPFNLYVLTACEGTEKSINNYERAWVYRRCEITDDPIENARAAESDKLMEHVFSVTAWNGRVDHRPVEVIRQNVSQLGAVWGIAAYSSRCVSDCENATAVCQDVIAVAATVAAAIPDFYYTIDGGKVWNTQASQFAAGKDARAVTTFQSLVGDYTFLAIRDQSAGNPLRCEVGTIGASSIIDIGAVATEGIDLASTVFALDARHVWVCTDTGRVYFSGDGAQTWTEQASALVASGGNGLRAIRFTDALVGYAVGINDTVLSTTDGGATWTDNPTGLGEDWLSVVVFDRQRLLVGCYSTATDGSLYMSYDAAVSWVNVTPWPTVAGVTAAIAIEFLPDGLTGYMLQDTATTNYVYKSLNGGLDWRRIETSANNGLYCLAVCQPNLGFLAGNVHDGISYIAKISG